MQRDPPGHDAIARPRPFGRRTGPAVAGNVTFGMISSTHCWSCAGSGVIVWRMNYSTPASDPRLERGDDLVGRPEQVDRLEVVLAALGAHHLEERAVLLLAGLRRVVRQHEVQEVLVGDDALAGSRPCSRKYAWSSAQSRAISVRRAGGPRDPAIGPQGRAP